MDMLPALKYVRMLYKKWVGSELHASLFGDGLAKMTRYVASKRQRKCDSIMLADHERVLRAVESGWVVPVRLSRKRDVEEGNEGGKNGSGKKGGGLKRHSCDSLKNSVDEFGKGIRRLRWAEFNKGLSEYGGWKQEAIEQLNCMGHKLRGFSEAASIDINDIDVLYFVRVIASFAQIERKSALHSVLKCHSGNATSSSEELNGSDVDWETLGTEPVLDAETSQYLMKVKRKMNVGKLSSYSPLDAVRVAVAKSYEGGDVEWGDVCKIFLLVNVIQEDPASAVTGLFVSRFGKDCRDDVGSSIARHLMGFRNSCAEHEETLVTLLTTYMVVDRKRLESKFAVEQKDEDNMLLGVKNMFLRRLRPSLTEMAAQNMSGYGKLRNLCGEKEDFITFAGACRFPVHMSIVMQKYIYVLKAMHEDENVNGLNMTPFIQSAITCPVLFGNIEKTSVVQVDESPVLMIVGCVRNIGEPALCLKRFRKPSVRRNLWVQSIRRMQNLVWEQACTGDAIESMNMNKNCVASSSNVPNVLCSVRQMLLEKRKLRQILKGHSVLLCLLLTEGRFLAESLSFEGLLGKTLLSQGSLLCGEESIGRVYRLLSKSALFVFLAIFTWGMKAVAMVRMQVGESCLENDFVLAVGKRGWNCCTAGGSIQVADKVVAFRSLEWAGIKVDSPSGIFWKSFQCLNYMGCPEKTVTCHWVVFYAVAKCDTLVFTGNDTMVFRQDKIVQYCAIRLQCMVCGGNVVGEFEGVVGRVALHHWVP
eukprot:2149370-Rhodomonas_salina.1